MPSSPNYKRDYAQEYRTAEKRGEKGTGHNGEDAIRHRARAKAIRLGMIKPGSKKDIDHIIPLVKGGAGTAVKNLRPRSVHANRSFKRTKGAGMA